MSLTISILLSQVARDDKASLEKKIAKLEEELRLLKEREDEMVKIKCSQVLKQCHACFSSIRIINNCSGFRLGWETALLPLEERQLEGPDAYDLLNNFIVNEYDQSYYIEKKGLYVDFDPDSKDIEGSQNEKVEELGLEANVVVFSPYQSAHVVDNPSSSANFPVGFSEKFDDLVFISLS